MRHHAFAMKTVAVCGITATLAVGCGSSHPATAPPTTPGSGITQAVTDTYQRFFDGTTGAAQKIALLENGSAFAETINAQAGSPMAKQTTATVSTVAGNDADHAAVTFTVLFNGKPALVGQQGSAVRVDGVWKVTAGTFCALLTMEGNPPAVCASTKPTG
jgi:hypothetical protein